jgi:hypothetical protein
MLALRILTVHVAFERAKADFVALLQGAEFGVVELGETVGPEFVECTVVCAM